MTANICMSNKNHKYNAEQRIANFLFTLWKQVPKWHHILFAVGMTGSSANQLFKTELYFRFIIYGY